MAQTVTEDYVTVTGDYVIVEADAFRELAESFARLYAELIRVLPEELADAILLQHTAPTDRQGAQWRMRVRASTDQAQQRRT